ncbi:MAG: preprotein translocase subunit SecE [Tissierellia bacterium]|jgi:preprotein translocase subunit SecE|nr:preprotein translocase subunit SecE [Tissierellia bacterium]
MAKTAKPKLSFLEKTKAYIKGVRSEMRKVSWPSKKELKNFTAVVVAMTAILALVMGLADLIFQQIFLRFI